MGELSDLKTEFQGIEEFSALGPILFDKFINDVFTWYATEVLHLCSRQYLYNT